MIANTDLIQAPDRAGELSQWFTPGDLAESICEWSGIVRGTKVLEPSCGDGSLVWHAASMGANVEALDIDPACVSFTKTLCANFPTVDVYQGDFLTYTPRNEPDVVLMNPPFEDDQDLNHVLHALEVAPRVVALLRLAFLAGKGRYNRLWQHHKLTQVAILTSRPHFSAAKGSPRHDFAVYEIQRGRSAHARPTQIEWWGSR